MTQAHISRDSTEIFREKCKIQIRYSARGSENTKNEEEQGTVRDAAGTNHPKIAGDGNVERTVAHCCAHDGIGAFYAVSVNQAGTDGDNCENGWALWCMAGA